ncbi:hypothetical protein KIPB_016383, partial [Kipferlia bialata]
RVGRGITVSMHGSHP